ELRDHCYQKISIHPLAQENHDLVIDGSDCLAFPGLIDMHTHLREPGFEYKEDIESASKAALHGGFTTITAFPNTKPTLDSVAHLEHLKKLIQAKAHVRVLPVASLTQGLKGETLSDFTALKDAGAAAFTDDGRGVQNQALFLKALNELKTLDVPVLLHEEDELLLNSGVMNEGERAKALGLSGISAVVEEIMSSRDILLAKHTGCKIHLCHVSTALAGDLVKLAKEHQIPVTAEASPHHLCFTEELISSIEDTDMKMNPPLRLERDRKRLVELFRTGFIDAIATDHAPHSKEEKARPFTEAPFGITGLETALPLLYSELVLKEKVPFYRIIEGLTRGPADILGLSYHPIKEGNPHNFIIFNTKKSTKLHEDFYYSKSRNFPLKNHTLSGKVEWVFYGTKAYHFEGGFEQSSILL
ncbi:MAG: dihydroorotase, partial [Spirochaetae bacterium HGW-Spirochaetae-6]